MRKRKKSSRVSISAKAKKRTGHRLVVDLVIRTLLGLTFALAAGIYFKNALTQLQAMDMSHLDPHVVARGLSILAIGLYTLLIACLYVLRLKPVKTKAGALPCAAAILGGFLMSALLLLAPQPDLPLAARVAACLLVVAGNVFAILILLRLGRSFSILPESRKLVTSGPYKIVRHPLYLAEAVATLGALINFLSPWALVLVGAQVALQLVRIHYEEHVLRETFPEYEDYARRTARLIPGVY
jgi:protein-S-isoprenylcysteine O-methyltransferase Ste14